MEGEWEKLVEDMKGGSIRALSKLITGVENRDPGWIEAMKLIFKDTGRARIIGITGSPGAGKSVLTDQVTRLFVERGLSVGIIAIDPSSPFSGGALLGDRLRMTSVGNLNNVFIRSMATRGSLGGLSQATRDVAKILDAFGKDIIIIETVGVGQDEIDVVKTTDLVVVVCVPGQGDAIQAIKAGIMEIADIFVVNKADREGADQVVMDIQGMLDISTADTMLPVPVLKTVAIHGDGIQNLTAKIFDILESRERETAREEEHLKEEILVLMEREIARFVRAKWEKNGQINAMVREVFERKRDPYSIVQEIIGPVQSQLRE
jgi:LAO/AO transport system kinase